MAIQTINVANAAELKQALASATGGETILLATGDYGTLNLKNAQFASDVTIKSADTNAPASISEMTLDGVSNLTFENLVFDYTFNGEGTGYKPFEIDNSSGVTIEGSVFSGDLAQGVSAVDDGFGSGKALAIRDSTGVVIADNEFFDWWKGLSVGDSSGVTVSGNDVHSIRSDGMSFGGNDGLLIANNYLHDFNGSPNSGDHRDMIQFSKGLGPSHNITIQDNVFDMGSGTHAQTIFMGNGKTDPNDPASFYTNVLIDNNTIYNAHAHGITVTGAKDLTISSNTILAVDRGVTGGVAIPKINVTSSSQNVTIDHNIVYGVTGHQGQADWTVTSNVYVQNTDPNAANYYDNVFTYHATAAQDGYNQYGIVAGSTADVLNAGSDLEQSFPLSYDAWVGSTGITVPPSSGGGTGGGTTPPVDTGGGTTPPVDTGGGTTPPVDTGGGTTPPVDAGGGTTPPVDSGEGTTPPVDSGEGTTPPVDSGEGTTPPVDTGGGTTPPVDNGEGTTDPVDSGTGITASVVTGVKAPGICGGTGTGAQQMVFDDFVLDIAALPSSDPRALLDDASVVNTASGSVIELDGHKDMVKLGRLQQFEDSEQLAFNIEFARDEADGSEQRLVWNKGHVGLTLKDDGLIAYVQNNDAKFRKGFEVDNIGLNDTNTHQITLMVDETSDRLQVVVDGNVVIDEINTDFDFVDAHGGHQWGWNLGTGRNRFVDGEISAFAVDDDVQFIDTQAVQYDDLFA